MTNLFTSQTPSITDASDGTPGITTGTTVTFSSSGTVTGVRFYATTTVGGTYTAGLWTVDSSDPGGGTLLQQKTMGGAPTGGTWNTVTFDTPISVTAGTPYRVGIFSGAGRYVATTSFAAFVSGGLTNSGITAAQHGATIGSVTISQGVFRIDAAFGYPNNGGSGGTCYFVDVEFTTGDASKSLGDTGSASEVAAVSATVAVGDTGAGADSSAAPASAPLADVGVASETVLPAASTPLADAGSASEALDNGQSTPVTLTDRGRAVDLLSVHKRGHAGGGGGWETLGAIFETNVEQIEQGRQVRPTSCPIDGYVLEDARGVLHCTFGGETYDYTGQPVYLWP